MKKLMVLALGLACALSTVPSFAQGTPAKKSGKKKGGKKGAKKSTKKGAGGGAL